MRRRRLAPLFIAAFLAFFLVPAFITLLTDLWWFRETGYGVVFTRGLTTGALLFLIAGSAGK